MKNLNYEKQEKINRLKNKIIADHRITVGQGYIQLRNNIQNIKL